MLLKQANHINLRLTVRELVSFGRFPYSQGRLNKEDWKFVDEAIAYMELEDLQDHYAELKDLGVEVYSVSTDTHFTHKAWHDHSEAISKLQYVMIGDPSQKISRMFDVLDEETGLAQRGTFLIDPDGVIRGCAVTYY